MAKQFKLNTVHETADWKKVVKAKVLKNSLRLAYAPTESVVSTVDIPLSTPCYYKFLRASGWALLPAYWVSLLDQLRDKGFSVGWYPPISQPGRFTQLRRISPPEEYEVLPIQEFETVPENVVWCARRFKCKARNP